MAAIEQECPKTIKFVDKGRPVRAGQPSYQVTRQCKLQAGERRGCGEVWRRRTRGRGGGEGGQGVCGLPPAFLSSSQVLYITSRYATTRTALLSAVRLQGNACLSQCAPGAQSQPQNNNQRLGPRRWRRSSGPCSCPRLPSSLELNVSASSGALPRPEVSSWHPACRPYCASVPPPLVVGWGNRWR